MWLVKKRRDWRRNKELLARNVRETKWSGRHGKEQQAGQLCNALNAAGLLPEMLLVKTTCV